MHLRAPAPILAAALVLASCHRGEASGGGATAASAEPAQALQGGAANVVPMADERPKAGKPARKGAGSKAGGRAAIAGATFHAGSLPGDDGRDPRLEPVAMEVTLGPYEIDLLPYPNDPREKPRTDVTREEAARLCSERGERLCTELEWELACRGTGDADTPYAAGDDWDAACAREPASCASGYGVLAMGAMLEWTASDVLPADKDDRPLPVARGARPDAPGSDHRCAHRAPLDRSSVKQADLGFRCCTGAPNAAAIPAPKPQPVARKVSLDPKQVSEMFSAMPQLAAVKDGIRFFSEPDDTAIVRKRGKDADAEGFTLTTSPLLWNPVGWDEVLVLAGRTKKDSFVVALYHLPGDRYRLASSMVFADDLGPFVLGYNPALRERLVWSSCWKCAGEGGAISTRDGGRRVVVVQQ